jgi:hypothetical protein
MNQRGCSGAPSALWGAPQSAMSRGGRTALEIQARVPKGFPDHVVRTVSENCSTLKLTHFKFEASECYTPGRQAPHNASSP